MKQKKNYIPLFILISFLLLGICLETIKTDFFFPCTVSDSEFPLDHQSAITPAGKSSPIPLFVQEKPSGHQGTAISLRRRFEKSSMGIDRFGLSDLCIAGVSLPKIHSAGSSMIQEISRNKPSHMIITSYIHHKDGRKS